MFFPYLFMANFTLHSIYCTVPANSLLHIEVDIRKVIKVRGMVVDKENE